MYWQIVATIGLLTGQMTEPFGKSKFDTLLECQRAIHRNVATEGLKGVGVTLTCVTVEGPGRWLKR